MTLDQALALLGMLTDTIRTQQQQIDALTAALQSSETDRPADPL